MKKSTAIISVVVATLTVGGGAAAYAKNKFGDSEARMERAMEYIADELSLDATQEQALAALKDQVVAKRQLMKEEGPSLRTELKSMIEAETFDQAKALEMVNARTAAVNEAAPDMIHALGNFLDTLNAEQKAEIAELMDKRGKRMGRKGRWHSHD